MPGEIRDVRLRLGVPEGIALDGIALESSIEPQETVNEIEWRSRHVFVLRGNWGFDFRLASTDPQALHDRLADFDKILAGLQFNY